jgi:hypothetical protein
MRPAWRRHPLYGNALRLIDAFVEGAWCRETASPGCQAGWTDLDPAYGQCAVTALVFEKTLREDFGFACEIMRAEVPGHGSHYWIRMPDGTEVDTTRDQFPPGVAIPPGEPRPPASLIEGARAAAARTRERFELLDRLASEAFAAAVIEPLLGDVEVVVTDGLRRPLDATSGETETPA